LGLAARRLLTELHPAGLTAAPTLAAGRGAPAARAPDARAATAPTLRRRYRRRLSASDPHPLWPLRTFLVARKWIMIPGPQKTTLHLKHTEFF